MYVQTPIRKRWLLKVNIKRKQIYINFSLWSMHSSNCNVCVGSLFSLHSFDYTSNYLGGSVGGQHCGPVPCSNHMEHTVYCTRRSTHALHGALHMLYTALYTCSTRRSTHALHGALHDALHMRYTAIYTCSTRRSTHALHGVPLHTSIYFATW